MNSPDETAPLSAIAAQRFRIALAALGLNDSEAAHRLGWPQPNVQRKTHHKTVMSLAHLEHIQRTLGIPVRYLLGFDDDFPGMLKCRR